MPISMCPLRMPISKCPLRAFSPDAQTTLAYPFPPPLPPPLHPNIPSNRHFYSLPLTTPHTSISPSSSPTLRSRKHLLHAHPVNLPLQPQRSPAPLQNRSQLIEFCPRTPNAT